MLISDVTIDDLKQYANVYTSDDDNLFDVILAAGKQYINTYTGLPLVRGTFLPVVNPIYPGSPFISGTGIVGYTITIILADNSSVTGTVQPDGTWNIGIPSGETLNDGDAIQVTQSSAAGYISAPTNALVSKSNQALFPNCADDFEDLTMSLCMLAIEMYDNRSVVVDNNKLNFVFEQTLGSYSVNLL